MFHQIIRKEMAMKSLKYTLIVLLTVFSSSLVMAQFNPDTVMRASIDRFSMEAGHLFVRDSTNGLPGPNVPVNFDMEPFLSMGLGPNGEFISYYNFDVQPTDPAPIYVLFRDGEMDPVAGQLNIVDVIPGDTSYNDFWRVNKVTVPQNYIANTVTSYSEIMSAGYPITETDILVNCPIVPEGSTAMLRYNNNPDTGLSMGWYQGLLVFYFNFSEKALMVTPSGMVPLSPIYVCFNINPGEPGGGPPSGFKTDSTGRTHNVTATLPEDVDYSPLWMVNIYDNADFDMVHDLASAQMANILVMGAANVNCPVVENESASAVEQFGNSTPNGYALDQNFPNPFNPLTVINYQLPMTSDVELSVYNILGEKITTLVKNRQQAGQHEVTLDGSSMSSGIYFYQVSVNGKVIKTKKMTLVK